MWFQTPRHKTEMPPRDRALPGRATAMPVPPKHYVNGNPLKGPFPDGMEIAIFGLGCFWGAERKFWEAGPGVYSTSVGYAAGYTKISYGALLKLFWESHDPTQGMRQGNDVGTQYRSVIYTTTPAQQQAAEASRGVYQAALTRARRAKITTEIVPAPAFYYAEADHQQYLAKNPNGYCGLGGTGVSCPVGLEVAQ